MFCTATWILFHSHSHKLAAGEVDFLGSLVIVDSFLAQRVKDGVAQAWGGG